ncbi:hypothetical protein ACH35V_32800 [Actinomadura sp. 1N219]|uniref:hypothetical protein n=1 Tax=Actinomadura sp. 1N219 TaxID=3375152 RepID=UPI0037A900D2
MNRGCGCLLASASLALILLLANWFGWLPVVVAASAFGVLGVAMFVFAPHRRHPGKAIGVKSPRSGRRSLFRHDALPPILTMVQQAEQDDPVAQRLVETVALLHGDGVPRWVLRVPEDLLDEIMDEEDVSSIGFAGLEIDPLLDRLHGEGLLTVDGDLVKMDRKIALAVRVRAGQQGRAHEAAAVVGMALYTHATELRSRANLIAFRNADASDADAIAERARALLDQAVTLAWHTNYTYDKALDSILQLNACLAELGFEEDAWVLARQMSALCARKLPPGHSVTHDAAANVEVLRKARRDGGLRPSA